MNDAKAIFSSKKQLRNKAAATVNSDWWDEFVIFAKAHLLSTQSLNTDQQSGINLLAEALKDIVAPETQLPDEIKPGLVHDLDNIDRTQVPVSKEEKQ